MQREKILFVCLSPNFESVSENFQPIQSSQALLPQIFMNHLQFDTHTSLTQWKLWNIHFMDQSSGSKAIHEQVFNKVRSFEIQKSYYSFNYNNTFHLSFCFRLLYWFLCIIRRKWILHMFLINGYVSSPTKSNIFRPSLNSPIFQ